MLSEEQTRPGSEKLEMVLSVSPFLKRSLLSFRGQRLPGARRNFSIPNWVTERVYCTRTTQSVSCHHCNLMFTSNGNFMCIVHAGWIELVITSLFIKFCWSLLWVKVGGFLYNKNYWEINKFTCWPYSFFAYCYSRISIQSKTKSGEWGQDLWPGLSWDLPRAKILEFLGLSISQQCILSVVCTLQQ